MKKLLILLFIATTIYSCDDQLDRAPVDVLINSTAFETVEDISTATDGVYTNFNPNVIIDINEIFTDNSRIGKDNGGQKLNILNQVVNTLTNSGGIWGNRYGSINDCNRVIQASEIITVGFGEQERLDNLLGQVYAMRAFLHFDLLVYYGADITDPSALGVPYQETVSSDDAPARLSTQETLDKINADLELASTLISDEFDDNSRITQDFITFLRARIALFTEDWNGVIARTTSIIGEYPLANQGEYEAMFLGDGNDVEVIYKYDNVLGFNRNIAGEFIFTGTGGNFIGMADGLFDLLEAEGEDGDIRFLVNTNPEDADDENTINKYPPIAGNYINDFKIFRVSEAYLMRAEAHAHLGNFSEAAINVQAIRNARKGVVGETQAYSNLQSAIADIAFERRLELCFEGHRYLDLKRYRNILNEGIDRDPRDCDGSIPCSVSVNDNRWVLPIPQFELNGNPNMTQNPNW